MLAAYLRERATEFLRALRAHRESGGGAPEESAEAVRALRRSARRISGTLHTFRPLLDTEWAEGLRPELAWLSGTLAHEHAHASRLERLLLALHRLSGAVPVPAAAGVGAREEGARGNGARGNGADAPAGPDRTHLTVGAAKAGALLDRRLTLARTRAHSTALEALGSGRFHAVADRIALLAGEVPLSPAAAGADLRLPAAAAEERLTETRLEAADQALTRHRDAAEAAAAAAEAARTPRIAPATAYALGVLHADQRHEVEAARFAFHHLWHRLPR
nr:CHAD domain-containing protein [Streptomyces sp. MH191]